MPIAQPPHAPFSLQDELGWLINRINRVRDERLRARLEPLGLNPRSAALLTAVDELSQPVSQQAICAALRLDEASVATVADRLQSAGLISRERDPSNRRRYAVQLTTAGQAALNQSSRVMTDVEAELRAGLASAEVSTLRALLQGIGREVGLL